MSEETRTRPFSGSDAFLAAFLIVVGAVGWTVGRTRPTWEVDVLPLSGLPSDIGPWRGRKVPLDSSFERLLQASTHVQRIYERPSEPPIFLYIGYYGTGRGGRPQHVPRGCYVGAGFAIERSETIRYAGEDSPAQATEYLVARGGQRQLVLYWYRSYRRTGITDGFALSWDRLLGRLGSGRADGALIRLSTAVSGDSDASRARLVRFAQELDPLLGRHWPREFEVKPATSP